MPFITFCIRICKLFASILNISIHIGNGSSLPKFRTILVFCISAFVIIYLLDVLDIGIHTYIVLI